MAIKQDWGSVQPEGVAVFGPSIVVIDGVGIKRPKRAIFGYSAAGTTAVYTDNAYGSFFLIKGDHRSFFNTPGLGTPSTILNQIITSGLQLLASTSIKAGDPGWLDLEGIVVPSGEGLFAIMSTLEEWDSAGVYGNMFPSLTLLGETVFSELEGQSPHQFSLGKLKPQKENQT